MPDEIYGVSFFVRRNLARTGSRRHCSEKHDLGNLPEWNLADLYPAPDSPQLASDLEKAMQDSVRFEERWKGKLADEAAKPNGGNLAEAIREFEALSELMGRIGSYAGLYYYGDTTDPKRMKLFGDAQQKLTDASTPLIFFTLELNRIDDTVLEKAMNENPHHRPLPPMAHGPAHGQALPA